MLAMKSEDVATILRFFYFIFLILSSWYFIDYQFNFI